MQGAGEGPWETPTELPPAAGFGETGGAVARSGEHAKGDGLVWRVGGLSVETA